MPVGAAAAGPSVPGAVGSGPGAAGGSGSGTAGGRAGDGSESAPWWDIKAQTAQAIDSWLGGVVAGAMAPVAQLAGSLLDPHRLIGISALAQLWSNSRAVADGLFGLLVLIGAVVIAGHETVQTRWALKQIAPRIVLGFLSANLSWTVITTGITGAAALSVAVAGNGMSPSQILTHVLTATLAGGPIFTIILQLVLVVVAVALVICLVVIGVLLMLLTVTAPLALCLHALPQTEQIAYLWWRALAATLAIPVLQGLILALLARVVLQPGGYGLLGIPNVLTGAGNLVNLLVTLALLWVMVTLPTRMWRIATGRGGRRGGGPVRGLVRTALGLAALSGIGGPIAATLSRAAAGGRGLRTGRALFSMLAANQSAPTSATRTAARRRPRPNAGTGAANPWARVYQTGSGQLILPLPGIRRVTPPRRTPNPTGSPTATATSARARRAPTGRQLALFSRNDLLHTPRLGRDGQYALPLELTPTPAPGARPDGADSPLAGPPARTRSGAGGRSGRQRSLFSRGRLLGQPRRPRGGQLALPLDLTASPPPPRPPTPRSSAAPAAGARRAGTGRQLSLFSPAELQAQAAARSVAGPDGQYRLPIRLTPTRPPPPTRPAPPAQTPTATPTSAPTAGPGVTRPVPLGGQTALPAHPLARPRRRTRPRPAGRPGHPATTADPQPDIHPDTDHPNPRRPS